MNGDITIKVRMPKKMVAAVALLAADYDLSKFVQDVDEVTLTDATIMDIDKKIYTLLGTVACLQIAKDNGIK